MVRIDRLRNDFKGLHQESISILAKLLNVDKSYIYAYGDKEVGIEAEREYRRIMGLLEEDYPIQYILGSQEFMGHDFYVEEGVLIPRGDTEVLVDFIINYIKENYENENIRVLDLCTGSGAIGLSIASSCKNTYVYGLDISDKAMEVVEINKKRLNVENIEFIQGNLFEPLGDKRFHIIVSNPPYISKEEIQTLDRKVRDYEPLLALDGGEDGLDFYRTITEKSKNFLENDGLLVYEIGYNQRVGVMDILKNEGFIDINSIKDLQGNDRIVYGFMKD